MYWKISIDCEENKSHNQSFTIEQSEKPPVINRTVDGCGWDVTITGQAGDKSTYTFFPSCCKKLVVEMLKKTQ